ncbi:MAG: hypothetical protein SFY81_04815 [Verrucomicrobiota bacterium]|nr:hypothetical protein [Verrucomicrobiota bacterium]
MKGRIGRRNPKCAVCGFSRVHQMGEICDSCEIAIWAANDEPVPPKVNVPLDRKEAMIRVIAGQRKRLLRDEPAKQTKGNMPVRAKFRLDSIQRSKTTIYRNGTSFPAEVQTLDLNVVHDGSPENKEFFALTPSGSIKLGMVNAEAVKQFELGGEYYVDFTPANQSTPQ